MNDELRPFPQYKPSRLAWLGTIPTHWEEKRAKYYFREVDERSTTGSEQLMSVSHVTGVTPRKKNVTMFMAESNVGHKICRPGDFAINTMWAWMGAMGVASQVGLVSPSYGVYRPHSPSLYEPAFVDHLLRTQPYKSEYLCRSTGIRASRLRLYPEDFLDIPVVCPPRDEQEAIVRFLRNRDRLVSQFIRNRRRLIEVLREQNQAIINKAVTRGLDPTVPLKPSGIDWLGDIPEHWELCRLRNVVSGVTSGSRGWSYYAADEGPLFIRVANLCRGSLDLRFDDVVRLNLPTTSEAQRTRVEPGDLLVSITAYIGSIAVAPPRLEEAYVSQHVARCRPRDGRHNSRWMGYVLLSNVGQTHGRLSLYGGTKDGLSLDDVKNYPMLLPPRDEQETILDHVEQSLAATGRAIQRAEREIDLIREYRTRLVADVVTGKLDVRHLAPPPGVLETDEIAGIDADEGFDDEPTEDEDVEFVEETADADD